MFDQNSNLHGIVFWEDEIFLVFNFSFFLNNHVFIFIVFSFYDLQKHSTGPESMVLSSGCKSGFDQFLIPPSSFLSSLPPLLFLILPFFSSFSLLTLALALTCVPGFSLPSQQPLTPEDSDQGTRCPVATQHHLLIMPFRAFSASNGMRKLMPSSDLLQYV